MHRIIVMNCNTSTSMTEDIVGQARYIASGDTQIIGMQPDWGPESAEGFYDSFITAAAVIDKAMQIDRDDIDGLVMAGFGEHGREGMRQMLSIPVVDITEASMMAACLLGHRFGVVTTTNAAVGQIEDALQSIGLEARCAGIRATDVPVLEAADHDEGVIRSIHDQAALLLGSGADCIILGCAGFAGLDRTLEDSFAGNVPFVDPVAAAVTQCEGLIAMGKHTSKTGPYAHPNTLKQYMRWPIAEG